MLKLNFIYETTTDNLLMFQTENLDNDKSCVAKENNFRSVLTMLSLSLLYFIAHSHYFMPKQKYK